MKNVANPPRADVPLQLPRSACSICGKDLSGQYAVAMKGDEPRCSQHLHLPTVAEARGQGFGLDGAKVAGRGGRFLSWEQIDELAKEAQLETYQQHYENTRHIGGIQKVHNGRGECTDCGAPLRLPHDPPIDLKKHFEQTGHNRGVDARTGGCAVCGRRIFGFIHQ